MIIEIIEVKRRKETQRENIVDALLTWWMQDERQMC